MVNIDLMLHAFYHKEVKEGREWKKPEIFRSIKICAEHENGKKAK